MSNYIGEDKQEKRKISLGLRAVDDFINACLDKYLRPKSDQSEIIIPGLAELLPDVDEESPPGNPGTAGSGTSEGLKPSGKAANRETGERTSQIKGTSPRKSTTLLSGKGREVIEGSSTEGEDDVVFLPPQNPPEPKPPYPKPPYPEPEPSPQPKPHSRQAVPGEQGMVEVEVDISVRVMSFMKDRKRWYRFILRSGTQKKAHYAAVTVSFLSGTDNNRSESLMIQDVANLPAGASFDSSKVSGLNIQQQRVIDVLFIDDIMRTVKVQAHEYKRK